MVLPTEGSVVLYRFFSFLSCLLLTRIMFKVPAFKGACVSRALKCLQQGKRKVQKTDLPGKMPHPTSVVSTSVPSHLKESHFTNSGLKA